MAKRTLTPPPPSPIQEFIDYYEQATSEIEIDEEIDLSRLNRPFELHPSSFPYCGIRHIYGITQEGIAATSCSTFAGSYFLEVGTLVHSLIQRFMAKGGKVYGQWSCPHCRWSTEEITTYPDGGCPKCGKEVAYEEIPIEIDGILYGHIDCLFETSDGTFWLPDYKTTMLMKNEKHMRTGDVYPYVSNRTQIRAYVVLIHYLYGKKYGFKPKGWILCYIPRDNPFRPVFVHEVVTPKEKAEIWERIQHDMDAFRTVINAENFEEIEHLIETKPCASLQQYRNEMDTGYGDCPLLSVCFNKKALRSTLNKAMAGNVNLPLVQFQPKPSKKEKAK
jgi:hypothetical protein